MTRNPIAAVVIGLVMVASAACTQDPGPATPAEAPPEVTRVTSRPDAQRTIYL